MKSVEEERRRENTKTSEKEEEAEKIGLNGKVAVERQNELKKMLAEKNRLRGRTQLLWQNEAEQNVAVFELLIVVEACYEAELWKMRRGNTN